MTSTKILIVEDDGAAHLEACLKNLGYTVCAAVSSGREAVEIAGDQRPDLALVDLGLGGEVTGPEVAERLGSRFDVPVVYLTDEVEGDLLQRAQATHPFGYVLRPFDPRQLHLNIKTAVSMHERDRRHRGTQARLKRIIGKYKDLTRLLKAMFNSMNEAVIAFDENKMPFFYNSSVVRMGGDPREKDIHKWAEKYGIFKPDGKTLYTVEDLPLIPALEGKTPDEIELFIRNEQKPEGFYLSLRCSPLPDGAGAAKALMVARDVTRLKRAEAELEQTLALQRNQAQLLATLLNSMGEGVVAMGEDGSLLFHNSSGRRIGGDHPLEKDIARWPLTYGVFQSDGKTVLSEELNPLLLAVKGQATDGVELFIRNEQRPEGVYITVTGRPLVSNPGAPGGGMVVIRDVTRLKQAEAELERTRALQQEQARLIETIFSSISDGIIVANAEGEFLYVNPGAEQIVGMGIKDGPLDEWAEKYGVYHPNRKTPMKTEDLPLVRAIHHGESVDEEDVFIRNRNRPAGVYIRVSARPLLDKIGGVGGGVIIFRDVTERVLAEEALARAFAQGRLEIVDTILHNIGNAINSVTTGIETVRRNLVNDPVGRRLFALAAAVRAHREDWIDYIANDPQGRKVMPFIVELAESLSSRNEELMKTVARVRDRANHIADIVRTQKALASPSSMDRKDVDLHDALSGAVRVLRDSINKRGIQVTVDCEDAPREICIQESQFHQMLVNLVKNSLEAIDELAAAQGLDETPRIRIRASAGSESLYLEVIDNGIGIGNQDTRVLFSPGYTTKESGSGLGLHSAANFVIALGGSIQPLSEGTGRGATMRVTLPLSSVAPTQRQNNQ